MKPEEMKRRATASPIPGPAPTMAITGLELGLWDIVFEIFEEVWEVAERWWFSVA